MSSDEKKEQQVHYLAPPVFPDSLYLRITGSLTHLVFVSLPEPRNPERFVVVADIVAMPTFLKQMAEQCAGALKVIAPSLELDSDAIEFHRSQLESLLVKVDDAK